MGLTNSSMGQNIKKAKQIKVNNNKIIALAGNPNVGKSTIFNALTGLKQHTGNWTGKTVETAMGECKIDDELYTVVDLPGTYSLNSHSFEEETARNFLCFERYDAAIVVCDGTCLERNLNLVIQTMEITKNVIVCINLMDQVIKRGIKIDTDKLSQFLGVPVVGISAHNKSSMDTLKNAIKNIVNINHDINKTVVEYPHEINKAVNTLLPFASLLTHGKINNYWLVMKYLENEMSAFDYAVTKMECDEKLVYNFIKEAEIVKQDLKENGIDSEKFKDMSVGTIYKLSEQICSLAITDKGEGYNKYDKKIDKILTGKYTSYPIMAILLILIMWITLIGANYPSAFLSELMIKIENILHRLFSCLNIPTFIDGILITGGFRVLSWVVSVMLPPMAIFFPLFTLLEDCGFLPRIAYNFDKPFFKCNACGKQALTMCMGLGCNAAGVVGCRIIDSDRERLLAILTNSFVPCNGKFPTLITLITLFFTFSVSPTINSFLNAIILSLMIIISISVTLIMTKFLSTTFLKGYTSSFTLELPSFRKPKICDVLVRSIFDRTLFVLGRAVVISFPTGMLIWIISNMEIYGKTIIQYACEILNSPAQLIGLDGTILIAFLLGLPANEIVLPIILMIYSSNGSLNQFISTSEIGSILMQNGWSIKTAICASVFMMMHWPCSTTLLTIKKETNSLKWTFASILIPTICGIIICGFINILFYIISAFL